jgi:hypothetical protein
MASISQQFEPDPLSPSLSLSLIDWFEFNSLASLVRKEELKATLIQYFIMRRLSQSSESRFLHLEHYKIIMIVVWLSHDRHKVTAWWSCNHRDCLMTVIFGALLMVQSCNDQGTLNGYLVIRRKLRGDNDAPFGWPTPCQPIGHPVVGRPQGVFGGFSYYWLAIKRNLAYWTSDYWDFLPTGTT